MAERINGGVPVSYRITSMCESCGIGYVMLARQNARTGTRIIGFCRDCGVEDAHKVIRAEVKK